MLNAGDIHIRDPFVVPIAEEGCYYLFGTTDTNCWQGAGEGFDCFKSRDLCRWEGPIPAFRPPATFWATRQFWAPEVHRFHDRYYLFASFKAERRYRGTQILVAEHVAGPYLPLTDGPITPPEWECLDGTLHVDAAGDPWVVFCHEWVQVHNGAIYALPLSPDLTQPVGRPVFLFNASEAPWVNRPDWPRDEEKCRFPTYITDGPFLYRLRNGVLLMLWSSCGSAGYALGIARSTTGDITGPWTHAPTPLFSEDGGHGMIFRTFAGKLLLTLHQPNTHMLERPVFIEIEETDSGIGITNKKEREDSE